MFRLIRIRNPDENRQFPAGGAGGDFHRRDSAIRNRHDHPLLAEVDLVFGVLRQEFEIPGGKGLAGRIELVDIEEDDALFARTRVNPEAEVAVLVLELAGEGKCRKNFHTIPFGIFKVGLCSPGKKYYIF